MNKISILTAILLTTLATGPGAATAPDPPRFHFDHARGRERSLCSDVIASIAIAALITLACIWLFRMKAVQNSQAPPAGVIDKDAREQV